MMMTRFPPIRRELRATLQSATSTHYASNFLAPAVSIDGFVQSLIATLIALPDDALHDPCQDRCHG